MIDRPDLDPHDTANRAQLRDRLERIRAEYYGSVRGLRDASANAGLSSRFVEDCEATTRWGVARVQAWARFLGHRFTMTVTGLAVPDDGDVTAIVLADAVTFGWADEDQLHVRAVVNDLARIRRAAGIPYAELAGLVGCGELAIQGWEDAPERCQVKTVQRYCRGLGGALNLEVAPVPVVVPA